MATTTTNTPKRVTKAQRFEDIKALLNNQPVTYGTTIEEAVNFCNAELDLLARKNGAERKPTATQVENQGLKFLILKHFLKSPEPKTCTNIQKAIPEFADFQNQKVTALVRQLYDANKLIRDEVKGKALYTINPDVVDEVREQVEAADNQ